MVVTISGAIRGNKLYAGKEVEILHLDKEEVCPGRVVGFSDGVLELAIDGECAAIEIQREIMVCFVVYDDAPYMFKGKVSSWEGSRLRLDDLSSLARVDQRGSYRVKTHKSLKLEREGTEDLFDGILLDISRAGARLRTTQKILPGQNIRLHLNIEETGRFVLGAEVVHIIGDGDRVQLGVKFVNLAIPDQEALVEYVLRLWKEKKKAEEA